MTEFPTNANAFNCITTLNMIENWANRKTGGIDWFEVSTFKNLDSNHSEFPKNLN